jgi:hypothetical protein
LTIRQLISFWFRPARDRDRQAIGIVAPQPLAAEQRPDREPFYSQTDRISSEIPENQPLVPQGAGLTIQIN